MKKFLLRLTFLLPVPLLIAGINYIEDPANIFRKGPYESGIVDIMMKGRNVANITNYDERLLQKYLVERIQDCPEAIVLGSSRVMQLGERYFHGLSLMNNGVSGASIEDLLAIYDLYEKKGCKIDKVLIGLEPYYLNDNNDQTRWRILNDEYNDCIAKLNLHQYKSHQPVIESKMVKYKELLSLSYFKSSWSYLLRGVDVHYRPTSETVNMELTKLSDGSIYYGEESRNATLQIVNGYAIQSITETPMYSMREFTQLSQKYQTIFTSFIEYLQKKDIEVVFFISPYHPIVYNHCKKNSYYQIMFTAEKYFREVAESHNIRMIGSYDPAFYGFTDSSYYDGFHCKEDALSIVLNK